MPALVAAACAEQIRQDDNIGLRGDHYSDLAGALVPMSVDEAREYYLQGLAQLDQMGGESYDQIYSLLHFAAVQTGGFLAPQLGQRLMNLCQTIVSNDSSKFGWTLFARACATSIGFSAIMKLVRWHDQDVAQLSYGLPQLGCLLAEKGHLDPRRAAFILTICEDHGWHNWKSGEAVAQLLGMSAAGDQHRILAAILAKLKAEHSFGGWPSLWEGYLATASKFPGLITTDEVAELKALRADSQTKQDEFNSRGSSPGSFVGEVRARPTDEEVSKLIEDWVANCDVSSAASIDSVLKEIGLADNLPYDTHQRFIRGLRAACPYAKRLAFLLAVIDATELSYAQSLDIMSKCISKWKSSSAHLVSQTGLLAKRLFDAKGIEPFEGQFSSISRGIRELTDFVRRQQAGARTHHSQSRRG